MTINVFKLGFFFFLGSQNGYNPYKYIFKMIIIPRKIGPNLDINYK
jgi:hypothetical protein